MRSIWIAATSALVSGCVSITPSPTPVAVRTVAADYAKLGTCIYLTLNRAEPHYVRMDDLRAISTIRVYHEAPVVSPYVGAIGGVRAWEITIARSTDKEAKVEILSTGTVFTHESRLSPVVDSCAQSEAIGNADRLRR